MPAPAAAMGLLAVLRTAAGAAARSGAMGEAVGGVARVGLARSQVTSASSAVQAAKAAQAAAMQKASDLPDLENLEALAKAGKDVRGTQDQLAGATKNFAISLGVNGAQVISALKGMADAAHEANKGLAGFNSQIAAAQMAAEFAEMKRNVEKGRRVAGTAVSEIQASDRLADAMLPFQTAAQNLGNRLGSFGKDIVSTQLEFLKPVADKLSAVLEKNTEAQAKDVGAAFEEALANQHLKTTPPKGRRPLVPLK